MTIAITFYYDNHGFPRAKTSNEKDYGLFCEFLEADCQTPWSCAVVLQNIQAFEENGGEKWQGIGNLLLLELEEQTARVYIGFPLVDGDYGEPNEMSILKLKELVTSWRNHLVKKYKL